MVANFHEKSLTEGQGSKTAPAAALFAGTDPALARDLAQALELSAKARARVDRATFVRPYCGPTEASGDFCDAFSLDNGSLALVVGDVSGRGPQAASRVPEARAMLRLSLYGDPDPASALACLNSALCLSAAGNPSEIAPFVCVSIAVVCPQNGMGAFACAGAEPPMIVSTTAMHRSIWVGGPPLGLFKDAEYASARRPISQSDVLIMGTNGIFNAGGPHRPLGPERLLKWANGLVPLHSLRVIGQMLMDEIESFAERNINDDCALLLARLI